MARAKVYDAVDFGAVNDGKTLNTAAIQQAIDRCNADGGGTVLLTGGGRYMTGTIFLKSFVTLQIDNGTTLLGSNRYEDYATDTHKMMYRGELHMDRCLIFAKDAESIAITGQGTIDGNGHREFFKGRNGRPLLLRFLNCKNLRLRDVSLKNPAAWTSAWLYCDDIVVDGVDIHSRVNANGDGLDFDGCTRVRVSNCSFDTSDDSICLQTSRADRPCRDVTVNNCTFSSKWAGLRIGLLSMGDIESVTVNNCTFFNMADSGLKIQLNEGGEMKNMVFSNLVMENVPRPIFMTFCQQRACVDSPENELAPLKAMHHMLFQNIVVDNTALDKDSGFFLTGLPDHRIEDIVIKDVQLRVAGGGTAAEAARTLPEYTDEVMNGHWPEFKCMGGPLPAYGIFARHIKGLVLENISIQTASPDARPPVGLVGVESVRMSNVFGNGKVVER